MYRYQFLVKLVGVAVQFTALTNLLLELHSLLGVEMPV